MTREERIKGILARSAHGSYVVENASGSGARDGRFLCVVTDGSTAFWSTHETLDSASARAATEYEDGMPCWGVWDLDTGHGYTAMVTVALERNTDKDDEGATS